MSFFRFDPRDVTRSPPIDKSILVGRYKLISRVFELEASLALFKTIRLLQA